MDRAPVFVKIDEYRDVVDIVALMREKLSQAKSLLSRIHELKAKEDAELENWSREFEEVESHVLHIDKVLVEPQ